MVQTPDDSREHVSERPRRRLACGRVAVIGTLPWTGALLLVLAAAICVACVVGRYHYVVDVAAGAAVALAAGW